MRNISLCLVISNPDREELFLIAQSILHLIEEWSRRHNIEFSPHKTEVMPICFLHGSDDPMLSLYDTPLKIVYSFLYLGTIITCQNPHANCGPPNDTRTHAPKISPTLQQPDDMAETKQLQNCA
jgi:hypothetical protein